MRIQMFGLPGAGKTFLAHKMASQSDCKVVSAEGGILKRLFYSVLFMISHPLLYFRALLLLISENYHNKALLYHKISLFLKAISSESQSEFVKNPVIDYGLCQLILSIYDRKISSSDLVRIRKIIPADVTVYIVESDDKKRADRMKDRGRIPRSHMGKEYLEGMFSIWKFNAQILSDFFGSHFKVKIVNN